jgi:hypothetical protein
MGVESIFDIAWTRVAAAHVQSCGRNPACSRAAMQTTQLGINNALAI